MNTTKQTTEPSSERVRRLASGLVLGASATLATMWFLSRLTTGIGAGTAPTP